MGFKNDVYYYMQNARCLILTSISENPGHVLIEAAANNCPIISVIVQQVHQNFYKIRRWFYI